MILSVVLTAGVLPLFPTLFLAEHPAEVQSRSNTPVSFYVLSVTLTQQYGEEGNDWKIKQSDIKAPQTINAI